MTGHSVIEAAQPQGHSVIGVRDAYRAGKARLLAVSGEKRSAVAPQVPTFAEAGLPDYQAYTWNCLFAPAQTPASIVERLNASLNHALTLPEVKERLAQGASESLAPSTPAQAEAFGRTERSRWVPFVRALNVET